MLSAALSGTLGAVSVHKYPPALCRKLARFCKALSRGTLHGSRCEYDLAELLGDKTVQKRTAEVVLDFFPDLCSVTPVILTEVVSAMVCNIALNAYGKALDLHVGEIHDKEPADNVEAGVGSLDAASPSEARAFIVELLEPLVGAAVTAAARHHDRKFSATGEPTTVPTFTIIEERVPSASPIQEYDPSTPCGPSEHGTAGSASDNERETPSFLDATVCGAVQPMRCPRGLKRLREGDDADELHHGGEGEGDLHCITGKARHERIDQTYEIAAAGPLQKKRKLNEEAMQSKATHTGLQGTERRLDPPRSKSMPKAVASPIDASRHNAPREESLRQITVDVACQVLQTLPKLDTPLSVTPPADAITYGPRVDQKMGFYNLHYILMSAIFEIHEPDTLSAYGASMLISGLSSQEVVSHAAYALGLYDTRFHNDKDFLAAIGRGSYHLTTEELRDAVLLAYMPAVRAALAAILPFQRPPALCTKSLESQRDHIRKVLALSAQGKPYDSGLTPFQTFLSTNDKMVSAMLRSDLLVDLEILK